MSLQEQGKQMCDDLAWHGVTAEWFIDPYNSLLLVIDDKWLMKCVSERYWVPVRPVYKSLRLRELGCKIAYKPIFKELNSPIQK